MPGTIKYVFSFRKKGVQGQIKLTDMYGKTIPKSYGPAAAKAP